MMKFFAELLPLGLRQLLILNLELKPTAAVSKMIAHVLINQEQFVMETLTASLKGDANLTAAVLKVRFSHNPFLKDYFFLLLFLGNVIRREGMVFGLDEYHQDTH